MIAAAGCAKCGSPTRQFKSGRHAKYCPACMAYVPRRREAVCEQCGKTFLQRKAGAKYCSKQCRVVAWQDAYRHVCEACGVEFNGRKQQRFCSKSCGSRKLPQSICKWCGKQFWPQAGRRLVCCSRECNYALMANRVRQRERADKLLKANEHVTWHIKRCDECGVSFATQCAVAVVCNDKCRRHRASRIASASRVKRCCDCGVTYWGSGHRRCRRCQKNKTKEDRRQNRRRYNSLRRARESNNGPHESFRPDEIFERDNWVCWLCGVRTTKDGGYPSDDYPTLDHVVPLSKGGTHTRRNVRCACHACNWIKSDETLTPG